MSPAVMTAHEPFIDAQSELLRRLPSAREEWPNGTILLFKKGEFPIGRELFAVLFIGGVTDLYNCKAKLPRA